MKVRRAEFKRQRRYKWRAAKRNPVRRQLAALYCRTHTQVMAGIWTMARREGRFRNWTPIIPSGHENRIPLAVTGPMTTLATNDVLPGREASAEVLVNYTGTGAATGIS